MALLPHNPDGNVTELTEYWLLQGNLGRGRWRRWFRVSNSGDATLLGDEIDQATLEQMAQRESLDRLWAIVQERQNDKQFSQLTVAQDPSNFAPASSMESGVARSQAVCRIARYFSLEAFIELITSIQSSPNADDYDKADLLTEIFTIPAQVATEIFVVNAQGKFLEKPLNALKKLDESQLAKLNPIPIGTGFLVGGTHLMTNNHVISDVTEASECVAQFNYVQDRTGQNQQTIDYEFDPDALFVTNAELDYTLVQLQSGMFTRPAGYRFGWLQLSGDETTIAPGLTSEDIQLLKGVVGHETNVTQQANKIKQKETKIKQKKGDRVFLIQHPKGQQKQIVQGDNRVLHYSNAGLLKSFIRYNAESDYGSSGSPVFNANWELVALHHAAIAEEVEPSTSNTTTSGDHSDKPAIKAYQGVRICRIVEDLQAKSFALPKLKSFIEDFVITSAQLNNTSLPGGLHFTQNGQYVSVDTGIGFLTGSTDASIKIWSRSGLELITLRLEGEETTRGAIEKLCFSSDGSRVAAVRVREALNNSSPQRQPIEIWKLEGNTPKSIKVTLSKTCISQNVIRNNNPKIGDLCFCDGLLGHEKAIAALSTDGYVEIWSLEGQLLKTIDVFLQDVKLPQNTKPYDIPLPIVRYSSKSLALVYSSHDSISIWRSKKDNGSPEDTTVRRVPVADFKDFFLSPDGQELAVIGTEHLSFWTLDGSRVIAKGQSEEKWFPIGSPWVASYTNDGMGMLFVTPESFLVYPDVSFYVKSSMFFIPSGVIDLTKLGIQEPQKNQATHLAFSGGSMILNLFKGGQLSIYKYSEDKKNNRIEISLLKTLFHKGAIAFLHCPTRHPFSFANQNAYTLEMWVRPSLNATGSILAKGSRIGTEYEVFVNNGRFVIRINERSYDGEAYSTDTFSHLTVAINKQDPVLGSGVRIYLNGKLTGSYTYFKNEEHPKPLELAKTPLLIGASITEPSPQTRDWTGDQAFIPPDVKSFIGVISEVRIWNKILTQLQIQTYANRRLPRSAQEHGLIGYWRFDEVQNNTIKNLVSDDNYTVVVGAKPLPQTEVPSRFTSGLEFNQLGSNVNCGNDASLDTPTAITAEAWVKHITGNSWIINRIELDKPDTSGYALIWQNNKIRVILQSAGNRTIVDTLYNAPGDRAFHHIAFTWGNASANQNLYEVQIYIDGRRQETVAVEGEYSTLLIDGAYRRIGLFNHDLERIETPLTIGKAVLKKETCHWVAAEVRLWNVVRTQNQIQSTMSYHLSQPEPGLVGYWRLDDGEFPNRIARNAIADWQGKTEAGHHGVIQGATWFPDLGSRWPIRTVNCGQDNSLYISTAITIEARVQHHSGNLWIVSRVSPGEAGYILAWQDNKIYFVLRGSLSSAESFFTRYISGVVAGSVDQVIDDHAEHHLAFTWDSAHGKAKVYIDGIQCNCTVKISYIDDWERILGAFNFVDRPVDDHAQFHQFNFDMPSNDRFNSNQFGTVKAPLKIGLYRPSQEAKHHWAIREVRLWKVARTLKQIQADKDTPLTQDKAADLVGYWLFDEESQTNGMFRNLVADWQGRTADHYHARVEDELALAFPSTLLAPTPVPVSPGPSDISTHWAKPFIDVALNQSILSLQAKDSFNPNARITLGIFISAVVKAFDVPLKMDEIAFSNLPPDHPSHTDVQKAYRMGFVVRSSGRKNTIDLERPMNRMEVMACLVRGLDLTGGTVNLLSRFNDLYVLNDNVRPLIATALRRGLAIINPAQPNQLEPERNMTRAELAALLYQSEVIQGKAKAIASPYLVSPSLPLFTDLSEDSPPTHWATDFIRELTDLGLVNGFPDGSFKPDAGMTRADFAALLVNAFNPSPRSDRLNTNVSQLFTDVPADHAYFKVIQQIYQSGAMSGIGNKEFGIKLAVRRDQAIASLAIILGLPEGNPETLKVYSDQAMIPPWAQKYIAAALQAGLVTGKQIRATQAATRAELVAMVYQGLEVQKKGKAIASPNIVDANAQDAVG